MIIQVQKLFAVYSTQCLIANPDIANKVAKLVNYDRLCFLLFFIRTYCSEVYAKRLNDIF